MFLLDISVFHTADANWQQALQGYVDGANYYLQGFGMKVNVMPAAPAHPINILLSGLMYDPSPDFSPLALRPGDLRSAAQGMSPLMTGVPVIFCRFNTSLAGQTTYPEDREANRSIPWPNYICINTNYYNRRAEVLLHELIHAAEYRGDTDLQFGRLIHDRDPVSIMSKNNQPDDPVKVYNRHASALAAASFARPV